MYITAKVDRFEGRKAILSSNEYGIEIYIPSKMLKGRYLEGETIFLKLNSEFIPNIYNINKEGTAT